jgi:hypothetical protein
MQPELLALERELAALRRHPVLRPVIARGGRVRFDALTLEDIAALLGHPAASLLLLAAADLNRTALRAGTQTRMRRLSRRRFAVHSS